MMRHFEEKVAILTGAASGIGKAIALRLDSEGGWRGGRPDHGRKYLRFTAIALDVRRGDAARYEQAPRRCGDARSDEWNTAPAAEAA